MPQADSAVRQQLLNCCLQMTKVVQENWHFYLILKIKNVSKPNVKYLTEALELIAKDPILKRKKVIVLAQENWHQGVIGIVASRLCDMYYKPCILISHTNGVGKGSGRSIKGFSLFDALTHCEKQLIDFGGHAVAAGLTSICPILTHSIKEINKYADEVLSEQDMIPTVDIDCPLSERSVTLENAKLLSKLEAVRYEQ